MTQLFFLLHFANFLTTFVQSAEVSPVYVADSDRHRIAELREMVKYEVISGTPNDDLYYLNWLNAGGFDVENAAKLLRQHLQDELYTDDLMHEDFSDMNARFPYDLSSIDKSGQPVLYLGTSWNWNVVDLADAGEFDKFARYIHTVCEDADRKVSTLRDRGFTNVTKASILINMGGWDVGYNYYKTLQLYKKLTETLIVHDRETPSHLIFIKSPSILKSVLKVVEPIFGQQIANTIKVVGSDSDELRKTLLEYIDDSHWPTQLRYEL